MPKNQKDKDQRDRERIERKAREEAERARERAEREAERQREREEREREQQPVPTTRAVMADLTLYNTLPPTVLYVLTDGSTLSTPGLPDGLAEGVRDLIVRAITEQQPPAQDEDKDEDEQPEEGPQEPEDGDEDGGDDVQPLPEHIDPDTVDEPVHVRVEIPAGVDPEAVRAAFSNIISEQLGKEGGV